MPEVSVVIPNYNGQEYLRGCLESLCMQKALNFEVIIIDNGSTDSDYKWIEEEKFQCFKKLKFKRLDKNYGFSPAVNIGISMAEGEYVLLLNNDTVVEKDFIVEMLEVIKLDIHIFAVSSKMITYNNRELIDDAGDEYTLLGVTHKRGMGDLAKYYNHVKKVFSACAGAALYRKKVFDEMGLFDEQFFAYMEDVDVSYRARVYGYYNIYCPKAKVYHIGSATSGSKYNDFKVRLAARNNVYVPYKNMPLVQLIINLPALLVGILIKGIWFQIKGYGKIYRSGVMEGFKTLGQVKKVKFKWKHFKNYIHIEGLLIKNMLSYILIKVFKCKC